MWGARKMSSSNLEAAFDYRRRDSKPVAVYPKEKRPIGITDGSQTPQFDQRLLTFLARAKASVGEFSLSLTLPPERERNQRESVSHSLSTNSLGEREELYGE